MAAGFAGAQVNAVLELKKAANPVGIHVVRDRGAAEADRLLKNSEECLTKALELGAAQAAGRAAGTDSGVEEAFVGVDVADAGKQRLVKKRRFDSEFASAKKGCELVFSDGERLRAWRIECRSPVQLAELETAEAARIDETEFAPAGQAQTGMGVRGNGVVRCGDEQAARHSEMDDPLRG